MKVLLVTTSFEDCHRSPTIQDNSHYPIGLAYLHAYLEECGHEVKTLFLNDYCFEECFGQVNDALASFEPDFIGFNILTPNRTSSFRLIEHVHENHGCQIFVGGIHTTVMHEQILKIYPYLIAVVGEGEHTTRDLINAVVNKQSLHEVDGIAFFENGELKKTAPRKLIENLDELPFPKHEVFFNENRTMGNLLTSRGCPFKCSFCVLDRVSQQRVRYRSVESVVAEIEHLVKTFPKLQTIWIHDDNFFLKNDRAISICNEIVRRGIKKRFICSGRFKPFCQELADALEAAGFVQILFGLESGSNQILQSCHKCIQGEDVVKTLKILRRSSIEVTAFLIVGLYGENEKTVAETIDFVKTMQRIKYTYYDDIGVILTYPGTEIYDIAVKNGMIDDTYWLSDKETPIFVVEHSEKELLKFKQQILDSIALRRFFSLRGFFRQVDMIPHIARYAFRGSYYAKTNIMRAVARAMPDFFQKIIDKTVQLMPGAVKAMIRKI